MNKKVLFHLHALLYFDCVHTISNLMKTWVFRLLIEMRLGMFGFLIYGKFNATMMSNLSSWVLSVFHKWFSATLKAFNLKVTWSSKAVNQIINTMTSKDCNQVKSWHWVVGETINDAQVLNNIDSFEQISFQINLLIDKQKYSRFTIKRKRLFVFFMTHLTAIKRITIISWMSSRMTWQH